MHKLVLVVENENILRDMLIDIIDYTGNFLAIGANSGVVALELIKKTNFDLITLDVGLPGINGNVFLSELAKIAPSIPVVVFTPMTQELNPHPQVKALLEKPFHISHLLGTIKEVCTL